MRKAQQAQRKRDSSATLDLSPRPLPGPSGRYLPALARRVGRRSQAAGLPFDADDAAQEAALAALLAERRMKVKVAGNEISIEPAHNPARSSLSTWASTQANSRLTDAMRRLSRSVRAGGDAHDLAGLPCRVPGDEGDDPRLAYHVEHLTQLYRQQSNARRGGEGLAALAGLGEASRWAVYAARRWARRAGGWLDVAAPGIRRIAREAQ